mmetsp:Transcript_29790/g.70887  ORF Transcript_29790/g.70887 Transcript_29790/m.70887 type:complete len:312 (+) Transcript_29790:660-1595(+)
MVDAALLLAHRPKLLRTHRSGALAAHQLDDGLFCLFVRLEDLGERLLLAALAAPSALCLDGRVEAGAGSLALDRSWHAVGLVTISVLALLYMGRHGARGPRRSWPTLALVAHPVTTAWAASGWTCREILVLRGCRPLDIRRRRPMRPIMVRRRRSGRRLDANLCIAGLLRRGPAAGAAQIAATQAVAHVPNACTTTAGRWRAVAIPRDGRGRMPLVTTGAESTRGAFAHRPRWSHLRGMIHAGARIILDVFLVQMLAVAALHVRTLRWRPCRRCRLRLRRILRNALEHRQILEVLASEDDEVVDFVRHRDL